MSLLNYAPLGFSASRMQAVTLREWMAGLWYSKSPYKMQGNSLAEMCDVEIARDGCLCTRKPVKPFAFGPTAAICNTWQYERADGTVFFMVVDKSGKVWMTNVAAGSEPPYTFTPAPFPDQNMAGCCYNQFQANGKLYISDGSKTLCWDGISAPVDVTATAYHDTTVDPAAADDVTDQGIPPFCTADVHANAAWLGRPNWGAGKDRTNEVWWSANIKLYECVAKGEKDYSDARALGFDTSLTADNVEAVVACGNKLMVMKKHSVHAIAASDFQLTSFAGRSITEDVGISGPKAFTCTQGVLFVYDARKGLYAITDSGPAWLMEAIWDGHNGICGKNRNPGITAVGACGQRVFVSIAEDSGDRNTHTYVYDLRNRNWSRWCIGFDCFQQWCPTQGDGYCLGVVSSPCNAVVRIDDKDESDCLEDDFGACKRKYSPSFTSAWFDAGAPYVEKRWMAVEMSFEVGRKDTSILLTSTHDWTAGSGNTETVTLESGVTNCIIADEDGCIPAGIQYCEIVDVGGPEIPVAVTCPPGQEQLRPADSTTVNLEGPVSCSSRSMGFKGLTTKDGRWCLQQITLFYKSKRLRA